MPPSSSPALAATWWVFAAAARGSEKLPPPTKAAAQMALIGIALVGLLLVVMILLGGHWVRRQGTPRRGPVVPPDRAPIVVKKDTNVGGVSDADDGKPPMPESPSETPPT
jgi:hypothetical protein